MTAGCANKIFGLCFNSRLRSIRCFIDFVRGRTIHTTSDGVPVRAFDSVFQAGVFHLEIGDHLRVEMDDFSRNCHIKSTIDRTFFGAIRIQSKHVDI
jgi:TNF(Tumour Necrosis Factor) family